MKLHPNRRTIRNAAVLALLGLALMVWPLVDYRPIAIVIAMSLGQLFGTISLVLFGAVVVADLFRKHVLSNDPRDAFTSIPPGEAKKDEEQSE